MNVNTVTEAPIFLWHNMPGLRLGAVRVSRFFGSIRRFPPFHLRRGLWRALEKFGILKIYFSTSCALFYSS